MALFKVTHLKDTRETTSMESKFIIYIYIYSLKKTSFIYLFPSYLFRLYILTLQPTKYTDPKSSVFPFWSRTIDAWLFSKQSPSRINIRPSPLLRFFLMDNPAVKNVEILKKWWIISKPFPVQKHASCIIISCLYMYYVDW